MIRTSKSISQWLFYIGIFLFPFDALNYLVPSKSYSPVSIYFFLLSLFFMVFENHVVRVDKSMKYLSVFYLFSIFISIATSYAYVGNLWYYMNFFKTITIGYICYVSMNLNIKHLKRSGYTNKDVIAYLFTILSNAYVFSISVGVIEFASLNGLLPGAVKVWINLIFGGWQETRLCITTSEASWAAMHMLIAFAVFYYRAKTKPNYYVCCFIAIALFLATSSTQGVLQAVLAGGIYIVLKQINKGNMLSFLKDVGKVVAISGLILGLFYMILKQDPSTYFASRILNFINLKEFLYADSSTFVRIGFLIINLFIFLDYPWLGIGGGNFNYIGIEYIMKDFPRILHTGEIPFLLSQNNLNTSTSLYFRILSELGIVGMSLFLVFFIHIIKKVRNIGQGEYRSIIFIAIIFALPIQFASYIYLPFWLCLALINNMEKEE